MPALGRIMLDQPIKEEELGKALKLDLTWERVWNGVEFVKKWRVVKPQEDLRGKLERGERQEEEEVNFGLNDTASDQLPIPRFVIV